MRLRLRLLHNSLFISVLPRPLLAGLVLAALGIAAIIIILLLATDPWKQKISDQNLNVN